MQHSLPTALAPTLRGIGILLAALVGCLLANRAPAAPGEAGLPSGTAYYVSPSGDDGAKGDSTTPFRTLQRALDAVRAGDTVMLREGVYRSGGTLEEVDRVTLRGQGEAVLDGSGAKTDDGLRVVGARGVTVENLKFRNWRRAGFFGAEAHGLTVRDCTSAGNARQGFLTTNASDVLIERCVAFGNQAQHGIYLSGSGDRLKVVRCTLFANAGAGLQINAEETERKKDPNFDQLSEDCLVSGNTIYSNGRKGGAAISLMMVRRSMVVNNLLYDNLAGGISLWDDDLGPEWGCKNNTLYHNTVVFAPGQGRYAVSVSANSSDNRLVDNILTCGRGPAIQADEAVQSDYNILHAPTLTNRGALAEWQRATGGDLHSLDADPRLAADYRLSPDSPARDAGLQVFDTDKDGTRRPQGPRPDCGCYEEAAAPAAASIRRGGNAILPAVIGVGILAILACGAAIGILRTRRRRAAWPAMAAGEISRR